MPGRATAHLVSLSLSVGVGGSVWLYERLYGRLVNREDLIALLAEDSAVNKKCRKAVGLGASFDIWDGLVPASRLARIYRVREVLIRKRGTPTLGFAAAVKALHALDEQPLRLGQVSQFDPPYHFQLFLAADATSVIACIGVDLRNL